MIRFFLIILSVLFFPASAFALDLGLPKSGGGEQRGGGDVEQSVAGFVGKSRELADLSLRSLRAINAAFESEEKAADNRARLEAALQTTDPKEKDALTSKLHESESATAEKNLKAADLESKIKSLSAEKQKNMAGAVVNLLIAALTAPKLIDDGQKILSSVSPTNAMKVIPVKNAIPLLQGFVKNGSGTVAGFAKVLKGANVEIPEVSATSTPVQVSI